MIVGTGVDLAEVDRIRAAIGVGYQGAVSPKYTVTSEQTPAYNHSWILSARLTF